MIGAGQSEPLKDDATVVESPFIAPFRLPLNEQLRHSLNLLNGGRASGDNRRTEVERHGFVMGELHEEEGMMSALRKMAYVQFAMVVLLPAFAFWRAWRRRRREDREREMEERRHGRDWNRQA